MSWELGTFLVLGIALASGLGWYERSRPPARVLALVAALAALAVVGRLAFAPFPNVKPTTDIVLLAGYALGGAPGFAVGSVAALVSNIFLSHGPWTPWQMAAWGSVGVLGGTLGRVVRRRREGVGGEGTRTEARELGRWSLAAACGVAGLGFGLVMDLYLWTLGGTHTLAAYLVLAGRSLPFNLAHAIGNVVFCLVIGPPLVRALRRYRRRFEVRWVAPGAASWRTGTAAAVAVGAAVAGGLLATGLASPTSARADSSVTQAARYLLSAQRCDGGFGTSPGDGSSQSMTAWAAFGLAAAGYNPQDVRRNGRSVTDYVRRHAGALRDANALSRTILLLHASGMSARSFAGRDFVQELRGRRSEDGSFEGFVNFTAFGVLALHAAGDAEDSDRIHGSVEWLRDAQNSDGGFGISTRSQSETEYTGVALEALAAGGEAGGDAARRAVEYLRAEQGAGGGFGRQRGDSPNAQATAWAVRGLVAAGHADSSLVARAVAYLRSLQASDGSIRYSSSDSRTPVWVTGDVLPALVRRSFPLEAAPRRQLRDRGCPRPNRGAPPERDRGSDPTSGGARNDGGGTPVKHPSKEGAAGGPSEGSGSGVGGPGPKGSGMAAGGEVVGGASVPSGGLASRSPAGALPSEAAVARAPRLQPDPSSARPTRSEPLVGGPGPPATAWRALSDAGSAPTAPKKDDSGSRQTPSGGGIAAIVLAAVAALVAAGTAGAARLRRLWSSAALRRVWPSGRLAALARRRTP